MERDGGIKDPLVRSLATYISSASFQRQFEQFFLDNALMFTDEVEHHLDYMTVYIAFQHKFNEHMEGFLADQGVSEEQFAERCQAAIKSDPKAEQYLDIVLASMDYDAFYLLMKAMRSRAKLENDRAEAKDGGSSNLIKRKAVYGAEQGDDEVRAQSKAPEGKETSETNAKADRESKSSKDAK